MARKRNQSKKTTLSKVRLGSSPSQTVQEENKCIVKARCERPLKSEGKKRERNESRGGDKCKKRRMLLRGRNYHLGITLSKKKIEKRKKKKKNEKMPGKISEGEIM